MLEGHSVYTIRDFGGMLQDVARAEAFADALRAHVREDTVVADLGTGTGAMALLAAKLGARHVYALEPNPAIQVARELARALQLDDRITFIEAMSTACELPERADVIVSDMRGVSPYFQTHIASIVDARERHLAPEGCLIPRRDVVMGSLIESAEDYARVAGPWLEAPFGLDMSLVHAYAMRSLGRTWAREAQLLATPERWCTLDYMDITSSSAEGTFKLTAHREGSAHGVSLWFETELTSGVSYTNAPTSDPILCGQQFLPLAEPMTVHPGDEITVRVQARALDGDYAWLWEVTQHRDGVAQAHARESTVFGAPVSGAALARRDAAYRGPLSAHGRAVRDVLARLDEGTSLADIAAFVGEHHADLFPSAEAQRAFVGDLASRYGAEA